MLPVICGFVLILNLDAFFVMIYCNFDVCLDNLSRVLDRCIETNLVLNFGKCHFMVHEAFGLL